MKISIAYEIPFHDVDSMNMVWHGHYYKYFELARTALYRSRGLDIHNNEQLGYTFPVIESRCRYTKPLYYGQNINITAHLKTWDYYLMIYYAIQPATCEEHFASGHTKQAVCDTDGRLLMPVPDDVIQTLDIGSG